MVPWKFILFEAKKWNYFTWDTSDRGKIETITKIKLYLSVYFHSSPGICSACSPVVLEIWQLHSSKFRLTIGEFITVCMEGKTGKSGSPNAIFKTDWRKLFTGTEVFFFCSFFFILNRTRVLKIIQLQQTTLLNSLT
jgi:hypothetical protein